MNAQFARRAGAVGFALLAGTVGPAPAWDHGPKLCGKECADTQRVVLPARQVEVVTEQPRVVVRETSPARAVATRVTSRSAEVGMTPVGSVGTVFMPTALPTFSAMPVFGMPFAAGVPAGGTREVIREVASEAALEPDPLAAVHRVERELMRGDMARFQLEQLMDRQRQVLSRSAAPRGAAADCPPNSSSASAAAIEAKLTALSENVNRLNERMTAVEKLLVYHDNWITDRVNQQKAAAVAAAPIAPAPAAPAAPTKSADGGAGLPPVMVPPAPAR